MEDHQQHHQPSNERQQVSLLIQELREACGRPLYREVALVEPRRRFAKKDGDSSRSAATKKKNPPALSSPHHNEKISRTSGTGGGSTEASESGSVATPSMDRGGKRLRTPSPNKASAAMSVSASGDPTLVNKGPAKVRPWQELLAQAATLSMACTQSEHDEIMKMASIFLLGFFLPHSTGVDYFLLQNVARHPPSDHKAEYSWTDRIATNTAPAPNKTTTAGPVHSKPITTSQIIREIPLIERIEKSVHRLSISSVSEFGTLTEMSAELALDSFLTTGLAPWMASRPMGRQVDILHLLAMAIHPTIPSFQLPGRWARFLEASQHVAWIQAQRLMRHGYAQFFHIQYGHRVRLVRFLAKHVFLPPWDDSSTNGDGDSLDPLWYGAVPHIRASLHGMVQGACCPHDAHEARQAWVRLAVQSQNAMLLLDEFNYQLRQLVEIKAPCTCQSTITTITVHSEEQHMATRTPKRPIHEPGDEKCPACEYRARGILLGELIVAAGRRVRTQVKHPKLFRQMTSSLSDVIEWQHDCWTVNGDEQKTRHEPCLLASLLLAAQRLFWCEPGHSDGVKGELVEDDDPYHTMIKSAIQLLRHADQGIVSEAEGLLSKAWFRIRHDDSNFSLESLVLATTKAYLQEQQDTRPIERILGVAASLHVSMGASLLQLVRRQIESDKVHDSAYSLLAMLSVNCPAIALREVGALMKLFEKESGYQQAFAHILSSVMSSRLARFFKDGDENIIKAVDVAMTAMKDQRWSIYQLAGHALVTGNFAVASNMYLTLLDHWNLSERHYLWLSVLQKLSEGEALLSRDGALGIPKSSSLFHSALSYLQFLHRSVGSDSFLGCYGFQIRWIMLRLDFIDLITVFRQLTREMRLTGSGPTKSTRPYAHLKTLVKGFSVLSFRVQEMIYRFGICFRHAQSRTACRVMERFAVFLGIATRSAFSDTFPPSNKQHSQKFEIGTTKHPLALLMLELHKVVLLPLPTVNDALIRAAAMLELLDGVTITPIPIPRDVLLPSPSIYGRLILSADPDSSSSDNLSVVEASPLICFSFSAAGVIPKELLQRSSLPVRHALVWYKLRFAGFLSDEGGQGGEPAGIDPSREISRESVLKRMKELRLQSPIETTLNSDGSFYASVECPPLADEGLFSVEATLGCRDVSGSEWEVALPNSNCILGVRVSRSK